MGKGQEQVIQVRLCVYTLACIQHCTSPPPHSPTQHTHDTQTKVEAIKGGKRHLGAKLTFNGELLRCKSNNGVIFSIKVRTHTYMHMRRPIYP